MRGAIAPKFTRPRRVSRLSVASTRARRSRRLAGRLRGDRRLSLTAHTRELRVAHGRTRPRSPARGRAREGRRDSSTNQDSRRCSVRGEMSGRGGANGSKGPGASGQHRWRTWQSDEDIPQRKELIQHMCVRRPSTAETRKNARSWVAGFRASFARPERARLECMEFIADLALFLLVQIENLQTEKARPHEGVAAQVAGLCAAIRRGCVPRRAKQGAQFVRPTLKSTTNRRPRDDLGEL